MPYYEYKCKCGHVFEKRYPINGETHDYVRCKCGKLAQRKFSTFSFKFEGKLA